MVHNNYSEVIKGEIEIIHEEIEQFQDSDCGLILNVSAFLDSIKDPFMSIENKVGTNSIDYINISTEVVDVTSNKLLSFFDYSSSDIAENKSASEMVQFYSNQRKNLEEALATFRILEHYNMDYAYRIKNFNKAKSEIEKLCVEKGIDIRTRAQKSIEHLKKVGAITGEVAKDATGFAVKLAVKVAIILVVFLIIMAIIGVK
jgi:hypothetical protein